MIDKGYIYGRMYGCAVRSNLAAKTGNAPRLLELNRQNVILTRMLARQAMADRCDARGALRSMERAVKRANASGITFALTEARLASLRAEHQKAREGLAEVGGMAVEALDRWQSSGATLRDLCNLCNRDYEQVLKEIDGRQTQCGSFSQLVFVHNLDYKNPRDTGWLEETVDAPFTHAIKEYMLDVMLNTKEGRAASHAAMEAVFPGIMENAMTMVTDADGVKHLIDKDGVEIGTPEEE